MTEFLNRKSNNKIIEAGESEIKRVNIDLDNRFRVLVLTISDNDNEYRDIIRNVIEIEKREVVEQL